MKPNQVKYKVSIAVSNNWFPGHTIKQFEIVELKNKRIFEPYLIDQAKEQGFTDFIVVGVVKVAEGQAVISKKSSSKSKASTK